MRVVSCGTTRTSPRPISARRSRSTRLARRLAVEAVQGATPRPPRPDDARGSGRGRSPPPRREGDRRSSGSRGASRPTSLTAPSRPRSARTRRTTPSHRRPGAGPIVGDPAEQQVVAQGGGGDVAVGSVELDRALQRSSGRSLAKERAGRDDAAFQLAVEQAEPVAALAVAQRQPEQAVAVAGRLGAAARARPGGPPGARSSRARRR